MLSQEAIQKILGIDEEVHTDPQNMAKQMNFTVIPFEQESVSPQIFAAYELLMATLSKYGVRHTDYADAFQVVPFRKRAKRFAKLVINDAIWLFNHAFGIPQKNFFIDWQTIRSLTARLRFKKGICIISLGELPADDLPMQKITNFKDNSIVTILDFPKNISRESDFETHFDTAMGLFAYHMTNIVIAADDEKWMIYNYNASHPIFRIDSPEFEDHILRGLIPKIVAPISPHRFSEFKIAETRFDPRDAVHAPIIKDLIDGSKLFNQTDLFPKGKSIDDLPFRKNFHKLIGKMHLDNRSGMSFGFFAKQMPSVLPTLTPLSESEARALEGSQSKDFFQDRDGRLCVLFEIEGQAYSCQVPDVWVMSIRSGADKTNIDPSKDLLKMGLRNGRMWIELPLGLKIDSTYKPSFDTKVILAHAVGNALIAAIAKHFGTNGEFVRAIEEDGFSMSHWHGYFNNAFIPKCVYEYGKGNPHVACSSPQSAIYALEGKLVNFELQSIRNKLEYGGDIHVEPHHGSNVNYPNLVKLGTYLNENKDAVALGNKYL